MYPPRSRKECVDVLGSEEVRCAVRAVEGANLPLIFISRDQLFRQFGGFSRTARSIAYV